MLGRCNALLAFVLRYPVVVRLTEVALLVESLVGLLNRVGGFKLAGIERVRVALVLLCGGRRAEAFADHLAGHKSGRASQQVGVCERRRVQLALVPVEQRL